MLKEKTLYEEANTIFGIPSLYQWMGGRYLFVYICSLQKTYDSSANLIG